LHDFRIVGSRVFCQRGDRELVAFDGDRGLVDWSFAPSSGKLNPHLWIGQDRIVLQVLKPTAILVLNTQNGRTQAEYVREDDQEWSHDPLPISDDQVALVVDRRSIGLFDFKRGVFPWIVRESPLLPRHGPPLLLGDAERLLVLYDGSELIRLDPRTGGKLWSRPLGDEDLSERPEAFVVDADRFYWATGQRLSALALGDGAPVWRRLLSGPETGWALALSDRCVAAYPVPSKTLEGTLDGLPLVFCRRETGALVERLLFQATATDLAVRLAPHSALIATETAFWALGDRPVLEQAQAP
jgi:outer membrane protein assembly factor BamB